MSVELERFARRYAETFHDYLGDGGERGLQAAYELGRSAVTERLSVLDLASVHHAALGAALAGAPPGDLERRVTASTEFLLEGLSVFEIVARGVSESREAVLLEQQHARRLRKLADAALAINSAIGLDEMLQHITDQARETIGTHHAEIAVVADDEHRARTTASCSSKYAGWEGTGRAPEDSPLATDRSRPSRAPPEPQAERRQQVRPDGGSPRDPLLQGWLAAPLTGRHGERLGMIHVADRFEGEFTDSDEVILVQLAQMASVAIRNARLFEREHRIAATLQRSLLPHGLPQLAGAELAARYLPAGTGNVGGDWYDAVVLPSGELGLAVGDVSGHGIHSAAVMGQLRIALRAYMLEGKGPGSAVGSLDRLLQGLDDSYLATVVCLVLDVSGGRLRFANAGHPPPLLQARDGATSYLVEGLTPPLGVLDSGERAEFELRVLPCSTLLLYTDGLVEERDASIDEGLARLAAAVEAGPPALGELCDEVLQRLLPESRGDDVALLTVRLCA